ncbi:MAG: ATP-binding protein [Fibrobacteraceae bacterium]|nr:ATP-binding protein [Fibrobacteraceae bacterium]
MSPISVKSLAEEPQVSVLKLQGDIGLDAIPQIASLLDEWLEKKFYHWAVDLSEVDFLSSPAVGALMGLRSRVVNHLGSIAFVSPGKYLIEKLDLMGVNKIIPYYKNMDAYLDYFRWEFRNAPRFLTLKFPAEASFIPVLRRLVVDLLRSKGYLPKEVYGIELIVDELSNNAIEHGSPSDAYFDFFLSFDKKKVEIRVVNSCEDLSQQEIDELSKKFSNPTFGPDALRGRGITLVKLFSNQMTFRIESRKVEVCITKMREGK